MNNNNNNKNFDVKPYSKEEVEKILAEVDNKLTEFIKSDKYKDVLMAMGNLGKYSFTNQIYILLQNPDAVTVNGMKQWNYLGRSILPGQKALKIFAPLLSKEEVQLADQDGNPILDEEGNPKTKEVEKVKGFKPSFVFDISQTKGKELDVFKFNDNITVEDKDLIIQGLSNVVEKKGFSIEYASEKELGKGCYGLCSYKDKKIKLLEGMSDIQTVSTLVHECGHALAHSPYRDSFEGLTELPGRDIREVEAESIACVVCSHLGLDTENFNFSYITGWADGDITKFRKNMDRIGMYSGDLIEGIDSVFAQAKKEREAVKPEQEAESPVEPVLPEVKTTKRTRRKEAVAV